jgi:hypothetical protein
LHVDVISFGWRRGGEIGAMKRKVKQKKRRQIKVRNLGVKKTVKGGVGGESSGDGHKQWIAH